MRGRSFVANGGYFYIDPDENTPWKGFGGRRWVVRFLDGETVTTTNLWSEGPAKEGEADTAKIFDSDGDECGFVRVGSGDDLYHFAFGKLPKNTGGVL